MSSRSRSYRFAVLLGATAVFVTTGIAASALPSYTGYLSFSAPTVTRTCAHGAVTQVTISVPFDASHLTEPVGRQVAATFIYQGATLGYLRAAPAVSVTIRPNEHSPLVEHIAVPNDRPYNVLAIGLSVPSGPAESFEQVPLSCGSVPATFRAPTVAAVSHPCLAATTARVVSTSNRSWILDPIVNGRRAATTTVIAPHGSATVTIGSALHGAERFILSSAASATDTSVTVALADFAEACVRGYVHSTLSAVRTGDLTRLTVTERPVLPTGTSVAFYRLVNGSRRLVALARTTATGHASSTISPSASHATYVAVIAATHYSFATTTPTATVG